MPASARVEVLGCPIDPFDMEATVERCLSLPRTLDRPVRQVSINAAKMVELSRDEGLAAFVRGSDVINADGQSVVWAARLLGHRLPERVAGIDLMHELFARAAREELSVFILGAREEVLETAIAKLRDRFPNLTIAGRHHGYFDSGEEETIAELIRESGADLLFVAMSSPRKERWLDEHLSHTGVGFAMGVGGAIDVVAGERRRAPRWLQRIGLEWLYRVLQEPGRMWQRYLVGNARFGWLVGRELARRALRGKPVSWA